MEKHNVLLLGGSGYIGSAFREYFGRIGVRYYSLRRDELDYASVPNLTLFIKEMQPTFVINAAGYTGKPNVDACEKDKAMCVLGNAVLPGIIRSACEATGVAWGHVSSGCIYSGDGPRPAGFNEIDPPNFCFRTNHCSFYSGTKALGEEVLADAADVFVWRLRIPFNNIDSSRNYLSKVLRYERLLQAKNSITELEEFVNGCWECWTRRVPFGIYNMTNGGVITTHEVTELLQKHLVPEKVFQFFEDEDQFMRLAAKTPRSNCVLDNKKILNTGIVFSEVHEAIERALCNWVREGRQISGERCKVTQP